MMSMPSEAAAGPAVEPLLAALRAALPAQRPVPLHEPEITGADRAAVDACLASGWISSVGPEIGRLEQALCELTGLPHALATVNGTSALHLALVVAGVAPDDEVLLPALTFVGSANPVRYQGAWPHFVDCEADTLGVDPERLAAHLEEIAELRPAGCFNRRTGRRIRALIVVHVLGIPARMPALQALAKRWRLTLIEDAAEALGSRLDGRHPGHWGELAVLSFNGNKIVSSGGGGALLCRDPELAERARHLGTTARRPHPWALEHDQVAYNYRMPNLNAALALSQLQRLPRYLADKARLRAHLARHLDGVTGARLHRPPAGHQSNHWLNLLQVAPEQRDPLLEAAHAEGIQLRPFWTPLNRLPMYRDCPAMPLPVTDELFAGGVCLPGSPGLAPERAS